MSKHWNPNEEMARWASADEAPSPGKWPEGATAGLALVAASCLAVGVILYQVAGPREVVEASVAGR